MDRIHSYEYIEEQINSSQTMTNREKENYLKTYKTNYYAWLDELKNKLDNYQPLFNDLDIRRSISPSFNYSEHNLKGEIWKEFPIDKDYTVSNLGRIKYQGKIQEQKDEKIGYVTLADENLRKDYIYNFVAYTFFGKVIGDGYHVHHITNDGYYNTVENLVLLTKEEHSYVHGFEVG
jgi:hypothetical protein